ERALRFVRFDVEALKRKAAEAVEAKFCVKMSKIAEGSHNKIYHLTFDNDKEAIARIPCPILGPSIISQVIASEVATMDYCRSKFRLKIPRVLAWSRTAEDREAIGTDFIIMEKVDGVTLHSRNHSLIDEELDTPLIDALVDMELRFKTASFSQIGSIYYKEDVSPELQGQARKLYAEGVEDDEFSERFRIGPVLDRVFWHGGRDVIAADRGPFQDFASYLIALAKLEKTWWSHRDHSKTSPEDTALAIELFDKIIAAAPYLSATTPELNEIVFWHSDLHTANIMISSTGPAHITGIIDWQNLSTGPYFSKACLADAMIYRGDLVQAQPLLWIPCLLEAYDELSPERQKDAKAQLFLGHRLGRYKSRVYDADPLRRDAMFENGRVQVLLGQIPLSLQHGGLIQLRSTLRDIHGYWKDYSEEIPCPFEVDESDPDKLSDEFWAVIEYERAFEKLCRRLLALPDGSIEGGNFEERIEQVRKEARAWNDKLGPFPFREGGPLITI
ncbi:hypothetical protein SISSUDRAFT_994491, partial [Sistotremastrum suecicum HHB10207 ss-3]